jgi:hypothetical protein
MRTPKMMNELIDKINNLHDDATYRKHNGILTIELDDTYNGDGYENENAVLDFLDWMSENLLQVGTNWNYTPIYKIDDTEIRIVFASADF